MALTSKELLLLQDNIKMAENTIRFTQGCIDLATDAQVKGICQQLVRDGQTDVQTYFKYINNATVQ